VGDGRVRYARNGDVRLAYREFGDGDTTLVWIPGWFSNVEMYDDPATPQTAIITQLSEAMRIVVWDKRGTGLSDPANHVPPLDERMDDLHAVLDAAGVARPALFGQSEGGPMSLLFAATYPKRVRSLVIYGAMARFSRELPTTLGASPPKKRHTISMTSKVIGVKEHWLTSSSTRSPTYQDFAIITGDISGPVPARRWRRGCGRRSWRSTSVAYWHLSVPRLCCSGVRAIAWLR
jgi:pimeloyl-ACP methyl ester carboxylesterase